MPLFKTKWTAFVGTLLLMMPVPASSFSPFEETGAKPRGRFPEKMTVTVVEESGQPVTNAVGFHRFGKLIEFKVDQNGVFEIPMMPEKEWKKWQTADFTVRAEGYGPFTAHFDSDPVIPETFTVVLKPAQKIGGIVVDEEGKPVEGVEVELSIPFETAYKTADIFVSNADTTTDAEGKWSLFQLPATFSSSPSLRLKKEGYLRTFVSDVPVSRLNPDAEGNYHEKIVIERGYTFSGKVVDETGKPIEGAEIRLSRYNVSDPVLSDPNGVFRLENLPLSDRMMLMVWASGRATQAFLTEVRSEEEPVRIVMRPGRPVVFDMTDSGGVPLPGTTFRLDGINGLPGGNLSMRIPLGKDGSKTDAKGRFVWKEAPETPFEICCGLKDHIGITISIDPNNIDPNQRTVPVTLYRSRVKLRVSDGATGHPVPAFGVITRMYEKPEEEWFRRWSSHPEPGSDGNMEIDVSGEEFRAWRFDVEAPGYETGSSRKVVYGEENVELEIRLVKSSDVSETAIAEPNAAGQSSAERLFPLSGGKILTPDGKNAENAAIEITAAASSACGPNAKPVFADKNGEFLLSEEQHQQIGPYPFVLKITHTSGAAVLDGETFRKTHDIPSDANAVPVRLRKWGRIEGTFRAGTKKLEGAELSLRWRKPETLPVHPGFYSGTTTKKGGRFVIEQVMPGTVDFSQYVPAKGLGSSWSSYCGTVEVRSGETTVCMLGGTGRAVTGKAVTPEPVDFTKYTARIVPRPENPEDLIPPVLPREYWPERDPKDPNRCNIKRLA
jgi:hypothetical protein